MKRQLPAIAAVLISVAALLILIGLLGATESGRPGLSLAAPLDLTVAEVAPSQAPNDLDATIVVTGTDFADGATVTLGDKSLSDVSRVSSTTLQAMVPWGMDPGVYTLTVTNPDSESDSLPNAFTVTQGIGVWNASEIYGGAIQNIAINPDSPDTLYAASENVGLFRSRDGSENWSFIYAPGAHDVVIDPITPTTIYWGTNDALYRSDDEGDTWIWLGTLVNLPYPHPTAADTLYATKSSGYGGGNGLWRSTDRGQTWVTATTGLTDTAVTGLVFHPTDPSMMYLGTAGGNVFRSTDAGDTWSYVAHPINYIMTLAINPRGVHELWVSNHCVDRPNLTLKSTNLTHTAWITVGEPLATFPLRSIDFPPLAWGDAFSQTVFVQACWIGTYRSPDGGDTWEEVLLGAGSMRDIALHPAISDTFYGASDYDGVLKSEDGGETFEITSRGIAALYPLQMAVGPGQPDIVYADVGRQGGIGKGTQGGANWQFLEIVESKLHERFEVVGVDPFTPTRVYAAAGAPSHLGYGWWIHISEDSGQTWLTYTLVSAPEPYSDCNSIMPDLLQADPVQPGALLAGVLHFRHGSPPFQAGGIYRSTDHAESWTYVDVGQVISHVTDLAYDTLAPTIVYAATGGSGMLRSTDGGQSWQPMGESEPGLDCVEHLAVEPNGDHRVFAQACGSGLYVSYNQGMSWTVGISWSGGDWIHDMLCTDNDPSVLYAAAAGGLLRMGEDGGAMWWEPAAGLLGQVPVYSLATVTATDRAILYVGTTGGYVESGAAQGLGLANTDGPLVNAGVYRFTTRRTWELYLPFVVRVYEP